MNQKAKLRELVNLYITEVQERLIIHEEILNLMIDDYGKFEDVDENLIELMDDLSTFINLFPPLYNEEIE